MGEVISDSQHAFVHGRQILDVVLIANEALDSRLKDNIPGLLLKMDIEKAFDHVNWNFLMEVMSKMGFGHRWINWIKWCCSTTSFSILINGSPSDQLQYLSWTFMWFEAISGLKVNLNKTEAIPVGEDIPMETLARSWVWKKDSGKGYLSGKGNTSPKAVVLPCGLGIRSLATFNKALLGKWLWRFANENEPLWKQIILSKYDLQEGGWCSKDARNRYGVGVWKAIRKGWENFRSHSRFIIGDGTKVKFWKDLWCGNQSLKETFPILFNLSVNKEGWVAEAWEEDEGGGSWGLRFNRHLNDWEVGEVESLLSKLHPLTIRRGVEDMFRWKENKIGTFSVKSFYSSFSRDSKPPFPARTIWTPWVPIRASFFGWEAAWNRLLTTDRLKRIGWSIPSRCFLCKHKEETTDHLLLFCEKARMLWLLIFSLFGVQWVMHSTVKNHLLGWHGSFVGKKRKKAWRAAPSA
ncbi:putative ribonuclease H protein [Vitis vinifera]|uniref:Putative ribonuclease H protein n=1 Tax=Vitis vinifera TaxID=29760 RepID=A0A438JEK2_VITVI|nr:putative ribonuclease H protein [Vitis vinifera]